MSQEQREAVERLLRDGPLDMGGEAPEQRVIFEQMMAARPLAADVTTRQDTLGGVPVVAVDAALPGSRSPATGPTPPARAPWRR